MKIKSALVGLAGMGMLILAGAWGAIRFECSAIFAVFTLFGIMIFLVSYDF